MFRGSFGTRSDRVTGSGRLSGVYLVLLGERGRARGDWKHKARTGATCGYASDR